MEQHPGLIGCHHLSLLENFDVMDNFEWSLGTKARFGLFAVDGRTQIRTLRPAAGLYSDVCRSNEVLAPLDPA